jgi:hypothetical protein
MAATKPADLCTHLMLSGKLCRGIALRNERFCHAHIRNHRFQERTRAEGEAINRFLEKVFAMDLLELLHTLHVRLENLNRAYSLSRFPEIRCLLSAAMDRLADIKSVESISALQPEQNQYLGSLDQIGLSEFREMLVSSAKSIF